MPRGSRHKSHRSHKHSTRDVAERSDSEDDGSCRDRRLRLVEAGPGSGDRVSRDVEAEKKKASSSLQVSLEKNKGGGSENGDFSSGKKRKEREEDSATPDRWNVSSKDDGLPEKSSKDDAFRHVDSEKTDKSRPLAVESKSRSGRRREGSSERHVESGSRTESVKRRSEMEHTRREYRDDKERDIDHPSEREKDKERASERSKKVQDSRHGRSDDAESKNQHSKREAAEVERNAKKDSTESQTRDDLHNAELEKEPEKFITKRRSNSGGIDKGVDDGRRLSSRDDYIKNGSHKVEKLRDERYKDDRYRDKHYKDLDRDQRLRDVRHREERSSRDYISDRLESKSVRDRDRDKHLGSYKKIRVHGSDRELSPHADDHGIKTRGGSRMKKRSYDEIDDHYSSRKTSAKESRSNADKDGSNSTKFDHGHQGKVDSSLNSAPSRSSLSPKARCSKERTRRDLKQAEYTHGEAACDNRARPPEHHDRALAAHERASNALSSEKAPRRDRVNSDDRERQLVLESLSMGISSQADLQIAEPASASPSRLKRTNHFSGSSPGHLLPQPPARHVAEDNPSAYEDGMRVASGDRRSNSRYRRSCDPNMERGQGGPWKNGPNWTAPLPNRFIPFQHGPPGSGFTVQHFPPPSLFGARPPYMEMSQTGIPYHMHELADRFPGQGHPFGWHHHHPVDGGNSLFGDKSQAYRGPDWNRDRLPVGGRARESNAEMLKGRRSSMAELSSPPELTDHPTNLESSSKVEHFRPMSDDASHMKQSNDPPPENKAIETSPETKLKRPHRFWKKFNGDGVGSCNYFSKIEISAELTHPELYKEIKDLLASANSAAICNVSKGEIAKNNKIQNSGNISILKGSLLPAAADATFKRAMSVYEKQNFRSQWKPPAVAVSSEEVNASLEATTVEDGTGLPCRPIPSNNDTAAGLAVAEAGGSSPGEVERVENPDDSSNERSDVGVLENSGTCEAVVSVCKVNLIRIHNSPESTR